ncbi:hypothetical protein [Falsirhodobacter halotolerans]|uniref:hypothetical protein n=1 Tax=Falsirhodobacter halotolerans TaxID=1146892 RepID=UPI001FD3398F|nr:hypothetical protein [Falsirhodobacter halotolerans]MCJ8139494.1 hypothetical protein [Falsirhodobacter halotolerans]
MFNIPDHPRPAVSTALRAPQSLINARRIRREALIRSLPTLLRTALILAAVAVAGVLGGCALERTAAILLHTLDQAELYRGM